MPRGCTVCTHAKVDAIDQALGSQVALRQIAGHYGLALTSLYRHKQHLSNGSGTAPEHPEQPAAARAPVSPALRADLRVQATALRQQAEQLRSAHRPYHEYPSATLLLQMALMLANVVEILWPEDR